MPPKQSRQELLEKKRLAERRRYEKMKNDPVLRSKLQENERKMYLKKKREGKILPVSEMSPQQQKIMRQKSRESSNRYNQKKKLGELKLEEHIYTDNNDSEAYSVDNYNSLTQNQTCSSNDISLPPSPNSDVSSTTSRIRLMPEIKSELDSDIYLSDLNDTVVTSSPQHSPSESSIELMQQSTRTIKVECGEPPMTTQGSPSESTIELTPQLARSIEIKSKQLLMSDQKMSQKKYLLRKMKHWADIELQMKEQRIQELTQINKQYKKQIQRLKKFNLDVTINNVDQSLRERFRKNSPDRVNISIQFSL